MDELKEILRKCNFNQFEFIENLQSHKEQDVFSMAALLYKSLSECNFGDEEVNLIKQSFQAFCADEYDQERVARAINGDIVSESESDTPEAYTNVSDPISTAGKEFITKKQLAIRQRLRRR